MIRYRDMKTSVSLCWLSNANRELAKKHVFGSSDGCRGGRLPNSCLRVGCLGMMLKPLHITAAGMSRKRWWRSPAGHRSGFFSQKPWAERRVPAGKTPWRNFCHPGLSKLVKGNKFGFMIKLSRWDAKIVTLVPSIGKLFAYTRCWTKSRLRGIAF